MKEFEFGCCSSGFGFLDMEATGREGGLFGEKWEGQAESVINIDNCIDEDKCAYNTLEYVVDPAQDSYSALSGGLGSEARNSSGEIGTMPHP
jgi:hypothetical protein